MLIANNRLPKRINANGQEVEKLVVSGTIWFDATSTIPAEGGVSSGTFSRISQVMGFKYRVTSQPDIPAAKSAGVLYKDKDGYCYAIDKTTEKVVKFNTTLEDDGIILDASDGSIYVPTTQQFQFGTTALPASGGTHITPISKYLPICVRTVTISQVKNSYSNLGNISGNEYDFTTDVASQYGVLLPNKGTKDYDLDIFVGNICKESTSFSGYTTITRLTWVTGRTSMFIDGTQS